MRIDLHTHSNVSDGTDTPTGLVFKAAAARLDMIALTDHDTMAGVQEAINAGLRAGVSVVSGIEITTTFKDVDVHLLGYGLQLSRGELSKELALGRQHRWDRARKMISKLAEMGIDITEKQVAEQAKGATSLGRPHIADAIVAAGYVSHRAEAFEKYLGTDSPAWVPRYSVELTKAIKLVHDAGGAAVIAHPGIRESERVLDGEVLAELTYDYGLDGIEVDYPLHDAPTREFYHQIGARLGLVRTGSSDYHGLGKIGHELGSILTRDSAWEELSRRIHSYGGVLPA